MPNTTVRAAAEGMPKINRRAFLGTTAAAAIVTAQSAAATSNLAARIAESERMERAYLQACEYLEEAEIVWRETNRRELILGPRIGGGHYEVSGRDAEEAYEHQQTNIVGHAAALRRSVEKVARDVGGDVSTSLIDAWEESAKVEARNAVERWEAQREACGVSKAQREHSDVGDAETAATLAVVAYQPVSDDDARAKVEWIAANYWRRDMGGLPGFAVAMLTGCLRNGDAIEEDEAGRLSIASGVPS